MNLIIPVLAGILASTPATSLTPKQEKLLKARSKSPIARLLKNLKTKGIFQRVPAYVGKGKISSKKQLQKKIIPTSTSTMRVAQKGTKMTSKATGHKKVNRVARKVSTVPASKPLKTRSYTKREKIASVVNRIKNFWTRPQKARANIMSKPQKDSEKILFHYSQEYHPDGSVIMEKRHGHIRSENEVYQITRVSNRPDAEWFQRIKDDENELVINKVKDPYSPELRSSSQDTELSINDSTQAKQDNILNKNY
ncbi:hypothetical protein ACFL35_07430 [Candidatus Riflebacteria bacterium]